MVEWAGVDDDSIKFECVVSGTGSIQVGSAIANFQAPPATMDGKLRGYRVYEPFSSPEEWENGEGTYDHGALTITRSDIAVTAGSAGKGVRTNFTGASQICEIVPLAKHFNEMATLPVDAGTFDPTDVQLSGANKLYDLYTSTGLENVAINATREAGVEVSVPWNANGQTLTWPSNCVDIHGNSLPSTWSGVKTVLFRWHPDFAGAGQGRAIVVIGGGLSAVEDDTSPVLGAGLNCAGFPVTNYTLGALVTGVTGVMTQAAHGGRVCQLAGDVTVPIADGFMALLQNPSGGATRTITPSGGQIIHNGATAATLAVPALREVSVRGDGTNLWVAGAVV